MNIMSESVWESLKDRDIINILDGDSAFNKDTTLNGKQIEMRMKKLSGQEICKDGDKIGANISYWDENNQTRASRWEYLEEVIDYSIKFNKESQLIDILFSKANFKDAIKFIYSDIDEFPDFPKLIQRWQRSAIKAVNNILFIHDLRLIYKKSLMQWQMIPITTNNVRVNREKIESTNKPILSSNGFYILPFQKTEEGMMNLINDTLKSKKVHFKLNKSGDIFDGNDDILSGILKGIKTASILVADISRKNPNVFYELGLANALKKPVIMICSKQSKDQDYTWGYPFDISGKMIFTYDQSNYIDMKNIADKVVNRIETLLKKYQ